jgi:hypothetical protein
MPSKTVDYICATCANKGTFAEYDSMFKLMLLLLIMLVLSDVYHMWKRCNERRRRASKKGAMRGKQTAHKCVTTPN